MAKRSTRKQRRRAPRVAITAPVHVAVEVGHEGRGGVRYTFSRDLSEVGMFTLDETSRLGDELELLFDLPGAERNVGACGVVRRVVRQGESDEQPGTGVEFTRVSEWSMAAMRRFLVEKLKDH